MIACGFRDTRKCDWLVGWLFGESSGRFYDLWSWCSEFRSLERCKEIASVWWSDTLEFRLLKLCKGIASIWWSWCREYPLDLKLNSIPLGTVAELSCPFQGSETRELCKAVTETSQLRRSKWEINHSMIQHNIYRLTGLGNVHFTGLMCFIVNQMPKAICENIKENGCESSQTLNVDSWSLVHWCFVV